MNRIIHTEAVAVTTTAKEIPVKYRDFLLVNCSTTATVYFTDKEKDGTVTSNKGFALLPGTATTLPMTAGTLSIIGSASADVRICFVDYCG